MDNARTKRNVVAIVIGLSVIALIAALTRPTDDHNAWVGIWSWLAKHNQPIFSDTDAQVRIEDLTGDWYFSTGDNPDWAREDFDHTDWDRLRVPSYWEQGGYGDYNGFAWYRREFELDRQALNRSLHAILGRIDDTDEVYINGQRIGGLGQFPPTYVSAWNQKRNYAIPEGIVHQGRNVIAVRVYDAQMGGGISDGGIGIYASNLPRPLVNLHGEWQFKIGDQAEWKNNDLEDAGFLPIQVPASWEDQGHGQYDGHAWYRKTFNRPPVSPDETLVLLLGKIDDTDEVFLNGEIIGRTGRVSNADRTENPEYYALDRRYEFPASLLRESNVLAVRIHDSGGYGGIYAGPVGILTKSAYQGYQDQLGKTSTWAPR